MKLLSGMIAALLLVAGNQAQAAIAEQPARNLQSATSFVDQRKGDQAVAAGQLTSGLIASGTGQLLKEELYLAGPASPVTPPLTSLSAAGGLTVAAGQVTVPIGQNVRTEQAPFESASLIVSLAGAFTPASPAVAGKQQQGFYLDNPDIPGAGVRFSALSPASITKVATAQPVPLPPPLLLFGSGLAGVIVLRKRGRSS